MAVKVHCFPTTTCSRLVLLALEICKVPYEIVVVDLSVGAHMEPSHKKLHPFGKVPLLEDDGFYVYESRAICKYIVKKYGSGTNLMPADGDFKGYALFEQACSVEQSYYIPHTSAIAFQKVYRLFDPELGPTDEAAVTKSVASLEVALAVYEVTLSKQAYLAGDQLTLVDLFHLPSGVFTKGLGLSSSFDKFPHVAKWFARLEDLESWKKLLASQS
ncbi:glutathione S-transferase [Halenospora varia]|nr:glutathione S-transferase [Halenospora varia]